MVRRADSLPRTDILAFGIAIDHDSRFRAALRAALFLLMALICTFVATPISRAEMRRDTLKIITATGEHTFNIEVAESDGDKMRGLMFRQSLADNAGMLFPYGPAQEITMWMKNTYISLDMLFIKPDGVVHRIATGTEPFSETVIASQGPVTAVLEIKAGIATKIGLKPGDKVVNGLFKQVKK